MKDLKKYYLALSVLIPIYIIIGFLTTRSDFFNYMNIILAVLWVICVIAFFKSRDYKKRVRK